MSDLTDDQKRRGNIIRNAMITRTGPTEIVQQLDAADAAEGIHRIRVDDETVKLVALTLGDFDYRGEEFDVSHYIRPARQVLAALISAPQQAAAGATRQEWPCERHS